MEFNNEQIMPACVQRVGTAIITIPQGGHLIMETSEGAKDICNETVPRGKSWLVNIWAKVREVDN